MFQSLESLFNAPPLVVESTEIGSWKCVYIEYVGHQYTNSSIRCNAANEANLLRCGWATIISDVSQIRCIQLDDGLCHPRAHKVTHALKTTFVGTIYAHAKTNPGLIQGSH
ncbi:hypothetical protein BI344_21950 [Chromobacterium sphagni]|uniref:Uncharacterized protein n=1 Tax=Chromobacterium sphagni TaxID=1903179 RepID=A0ABX3C7D3_9NEIS|nr:hypothetical protein BI344_21950 [Chromobacterium sphagni]